MSIQSSELKWEALQEIFACAFKRMLEHHFPTEEYSALIELWAAEERRIRRAGLQATIAAFRRNRAARARLRLAATRPDFPIEPSEKGNYENEASEASEETAVA